MNGSNCLVVHQRVGVWPTSSLPKFFRCFFRIPENTSCILNTMLVFDVLKHQAISTHSADYMLIVLVQFHTKILHLQITTLDKKWKQIPICLEVKGRQYNVSFLILPFTMTSKIAQLTLQQNVCNETQRCSFIAYITISLGTKVVVYLGICCMQDDVVNVFFRHCNYVNHGHRALLL